MVTTITFIGLIMLTNLSNNGAQVLIGKFPPHLARIAYKQGTLVSHSQWPKVGEFAVNGVKYDYVNVNIENISFSGPTDAFVNAVGAIPHLSCCCPEMTGVKPEYNNPAQPVATKKGAIVTISNGILITYAQPDNAIATQVVLTGAPQLTITGTVAGNASRQLVLSAGTTVVITNSPPSTFSGTHSTTRDDFKDFYQMGINASTCTKVPGDGGSCAPQTGACPTTAPAKAAAAKAAPAKLTAQQKSLVAAARKLSPMYVTDVNCSNSTWP